MMNAQEIFEAIKGEVNYCESTRIMQNPPFVPTEMQRLDLIDRYMMSRYRDGDTDSFGNQMVFYNISSFPVEVASKMVDVDTKDIQLSALDERYWETWLMERDLSQWMEDREFGTFLNEFSFRLPRDGHVIAKKIDDQVELVPLKNLRFRPNVLSLEKTPIIERYEYMADEFVKEAKERGWSNWESVSLISDKTQSGVFNKSDKIIVYGCWFPEGFLGTESNYFIVSYDGHILADWFQELFYKGMPWEKIHGRLLGRGNVEKLFNEQIYLNRIANYKADGLNWTSKHYFQTRDNTFKSQLIGTNDNGEIFTPNDPIEPIAVEERNLSFYGQEEARWEGHAYRRVFTQEPITGGRSPSGTPLGSTILQAQMAQGFYDPKKENMAIFIKEILQDWIMPEFIKDKRGSHALMMKNLLSSENGSEKLFNLQLNYMLNMQKMTKFLPPAMWEAKKVLLAEELKNKKFELPRGFYDDLQYKMRVNIGSEAIDTAGKMTTLQTLFQIIGSNPTVLENKMTKNILFKMLNIAGFNPHDFADDDMPTIQNATQMAQTQRGGSIAAPPPQMLSTPSQIPSQISI